MSFNLGRLIAKLERADKLREAEENGAWVIRVSRIKRVKSKSEHEVRQHDSASCFHDISYTMPCSRCRRSRADADAQRERIRVQIQSNQ